MKNFDFMLTAFRDGFQSVYGARVFTDDFIPAVEAARDAGIRYFEAGGGARYQSLYLYCNEDASGTTTPAVVYESIARARKMLPEGTYIHFHTHDTAGTAVACNKAALEAGANAIDLSMAPCSGGTEKPDILTMWHALRHTDYQMDVDVDKIREVEEVFQDCMKDYFLPPEATKVEPIIPWCPMPGGALTANTQMLRDNGIMEKYPAIIKAMGDVVRKGGFGTSVTPVSQFYFQQAFNNVMFGPWEKISEPFGRMVLGYFGKTPVPPDEDVVALAAKQLELEPTTEKAVDRNNADPTKGVKAVEKQLKEEGFPVTDENVFIVASCGPKGITFLKGEATTAVRKIEPEPATPPAPPAPPSPPPPETTGSYEVRVDGTVYEVEIDDGRVFVGGEEVFVETLNGELPGSDKKEPMRLLCQADGLVYQIKADPGDKLKAGDPILVLESLKMEMAVKSPRDGVLTEVSVRQGDNVRAGQVLAIVTPE